VTRLVAQSAALKRVLAVIERAAPSRVPVVFVGESGVGKERFARLLHDKSGRPADRFVPVACGAIPEQLAEGLLFGHVRGAFSGAERDAAGLIRSADGGTLFLDDISVLPLPMQARLLRTVDGGEVTPLGGETLRVDVRIAVASPVALEALVRAGRLREDLCYRLASVSVEIPPLRDRPEDVHLLLDGALAAAGCSASQEAKALLLGHGWPGNVRELLHVMEAASVLVGKGGDVGVEHLPERIAGRAPQTSVASLLPGPDESLEVRPRLAALERVLIQEALRRHGGNRRAAAKACGLSPRAFLYKLRASGMDQ